MIPDYYRPFNPDPAAVCAACLHVHTPDAPPRTTYCAELHPQQRPDVTVTAFGDIPEPHLHRACIRCGYTWLEQTATDLL